MSKSTRMPCSIMRKFERVESYAALVHQSYLYREKAMLRAREAKLDGAKPLVRLAVQAARGWNHCMLRELRDLRRAREAKQRIDALAFEQCQSIILGKGA